MDKKEWLTLRAEARTEMKTLLNRVLPEHHRPEAWSPREVFHHVLLVDQANANLLERLVAKNSTVELRDPGLVWPFRRELLDFPLDTAFSVPAFKGTEPRLKVTDQELADLERDADARLTALADKADHVELSSISFPHPLAGKMNFYEWLVFEVVHERLHLRQLNEDLVSHS